MAPYELPTSPHLTVKGAAAAIDFYTEAFGAEEGCRSTQPGTDVIMHATVMIGDSPVMLNDEMPEYGVVGPGEHGGPVTIHIYAEDIDATFKRVVDVGAEMLNPVATMFWGDRYGILKDPFGHKWSIATVVELVDPAEVEARAGKFFGGGSDGSKPC